eukprot:2066367-Amphidinium_carterae.1
MRARQVFKASAAERVITRTTISVLLDSSSSSTGLNIAEMRSDLGPKTSDRKSTEDGRNERTPRTCIADVAVREWCSTAGVVTHTHTHTGLRRQTQKLKRSAAPEKTAQATLSPDG